MGKRAGGIRSGLCQPTDFLLRVYQRLLVTKYQQTPPLLLGQYCLYHLPIKPSHHRPIAAIVYLNEKSKHLRFITINPVLL